MFVLGDEEQLTGGDRTRTLKTLGLNLRATQMIRRCGIAVLRF